MIQDEAVPGVYYVRRGHGESGPFHGVMGGLHGNEPCGARAIEALIDGFESGRLTPGNGTVVLIVANPAALSAGTRYTEGGEDLNRLFDYDFVRTRPTADYTAEHHRALALRPVLERLDSLIDLHSATWPTPPFAIVNEVPEAHAIAATLATPFVTSGWTSPGLLMDKVSIGVLQRRGRPAMSVECGSHGTASSDEVALDCALRYLDTMGALKTTATSSLPTAARPPQQLTVVEAVRKMSPHTRLAPGIAAMTQLKSGDLLAEDRLTQLRVKGPCYVLLPNDTVPVGVDMAYLAQAN